MNAAERAPVNRSADAARAWAGAAVLSRGFRPFFLAAGVWALSGSDCGRPCSRGRFDPDRVLRRRLARARDDFGYGAAVVAGFLLTAIPNWTGRLPVAGLPLAGLAALWAAGRVAVFVSADLGRVAAAAIDVSFLVAFAAVVAREVVAGRNMRNAKVVARRPVARARQRRLPRRGRDVGLAAKFSIRAALGLIVFLILLIGGRVTPSFTGNWLAKAGVARGPSRSGGRTGPYRAVRRDARDMGRGARGVAAGALAIVSGAANVWRLSRWRGLAARSDPLVLVLHLGIPFRRPRLHGLGASALWPAFVPYAFGVHVWAIGAVGVMTLAMMTRATLGHTGHALKASKGTVFAYGCVVVALAARLAMALLPGLALPLMHIAACAWVLAFAAFLVVYAPMLVRRSGPA